MRSALRTKLARRAEALALARYFFAERGITEVDCLALSPTAATDVNIDLFSVHSPIHGRRFLFSSPEFPMKRLLSQESGDIFYLGHVWRHEEAGERHSPEFLLAEWYRLGISFHHMIDETIEFVERFIGGHTKCLLTYRDAFLQHAAIDPYDSSLDELREACSAFHGYPIESSSRDELLNLLLAMNVEPSFDPQAITVLYHYPASQAALARHQTVDGHSVAERFEIYCGGLELANGYHELSDAYEQKARFDTDNEVRRTMGKEQYPLDGHFLAALQQGLPDCCGVAVGMDRLLMLREQTPTIGGVMPIAWESA